MNAVPFVLHYIKNTHLMAGIGNITSTVG